MESKKINFDELPFELTPEENENFFQILPKQLQIISETNMEMFQEKVMEYIAKEKLLFKSIEDYYNSAIASKYFDDGVILASSILFGELKKFAVQFDIVFIDKNMQDAPNSGTIEIVAKSLNDAWKNAFASINQYLRGQNEVVKSLNVTNINIL